eukprot:CAMPEP_0197845508 /NCGR_PEP_ID=MMETSP1438-20131217/2428_1 /TAXON_ID=1461541 /ORGANISM="Pterosperma sp., Strain CCMP1384" /LENGTH=268 /DNA_ID=CAMNT_0043456827 /DNA_START=27 /DNA_END=833 /DNA_ORIENTATION=-
MAAMTSTSVRMTPVGLSSSNRQSVTAKHLPPLPPRVSPVNLKGSSFTGTPVTLSPKIEARRARPAAAQRLVVEARKEIPISVEKPLGITFGAKRGGEGGVVATFVAPGSNAAAAGMKSGDQILYHSSFFGEELWPGDNVGFTKTAINACPNEVDFIVLRGKDVGTVNVKRLPKREAPKKFGKKLTAAQKSRATHICLDCGFIYALKVPFEEQDSSYVCPQCLSGKSRFSGYDPETGKTIGGTGLPLAVSLSLGIGLVAGIGLIAVGLN